MRTSAPRYARANRSREDVARIYDGAQYLGNIERTATKYTVDCAVVRQQRMAGRSRRRPFMSNIGIAALAILVVFLGGTQICQACDLFNKMHGNASNLTVSEADKDEIVGIVGTVTGKSCKTDSVKEVATVPADAEALKKWQMPEPAAQNPVHEDNNAPAAPVQEPSVQGYKQALPGFNFQFPKDHGSHNQYRSEWWYYSGHLNGKNGKTYGFELTFFRLAGDYEPNNPNSAWKGENYNLAHFTITDENGKTFFVDEKTSHAKAASAGARSDKCYVYNQDWSVSMEGDDFVLDAHSPEYSIHLLLDSKKPPVIHGVNGFCLKSARTGEGTHYYSMTRLKTKGTLFIGDKPVEVTGQSWMDHEFGSYKLTPEQCGWDWYSLQLDDNRELMLCLIRRLDGSLEPASCGTIVDAQGNSKYLRIDEFGVTNTGTWHSDKSGGNYPMGWHVSVPDESLALTITTKVKNQELNTAAPIGISYWEGAVQLEGISHGKPVKGQGYAEMTGYCERNKVSIF